MGDAKAQYGVDSSSGETAAPETGQSGPASAERLDYMADLIDELRNMAEEQGHVTLAAVLALAKTEAQQCSLRAIGAAGTHTSARRAG